MNQIQEIVSKPHNNDFVTGLIVEAAHQVEKWGEAHTRGKEPEDWLWLLGWLISKATMSHRTGDIEKAKHHCISSAAVLLQWHSFLSGHDTTFIPGDSDLQRHLELVLGVSLDEQPVDVESFRDVIGGGQPALVLPTNTPIPVDGEAWLSIATAPKNGKPVKITSMVGVTGWMYYDADFETWVDAWNGRPIKEFVPALWRPLTPSEDAQLKAVWNSQAMEAKDND